MPDGVDCCSNRNERQGLLDSLSESIAQYLQENVEADRKLRKLFFRAIVSIIGALLQSFLRKYANSGESTNSNVSQ